jgi:tetratricopeptide (TPR) repeat protein
MRKPFIALAAVAALLGLELPWSALADDPNADEVDLALLPEWCKVVMAGGDAVQRSNDQRVRAKLFDITSSHCSGYHHYCWALVWANRGRFRDAGPDRTRYYFEVAIDDLEYVFHHSDSKNCKLAPEMHTKIGEWKLQLDNLKGAEESFRSALAIKPSYAPAYLGLSDLYETQGTIEKSIEVLQAGIKANPKSVALEKKLKRVQQRSPGTSAAP